MENYNLRRGTQLDVKEEQRLINSILEGGEGTGNRKWAMKSRDRERERGRQEEQRDVVQSGNTHTAWWTTDVIQDQENKRKENRKKRYLNKYDISK